MKKIIYSIIRLLARGVLKKYKPDVVGITGSVGKTTTKDAIALVMSGRFHIRASERSMNTEVGLPLTVLGCENPGKNVLAWLLVFWKGLWLLVHRDHEYPPILVLEMAADKKGDIAYLCSITQPRIGVVTALSEVHLAHFKSLEGVAKEKQTLIASLPRNGWAVLNADDPRVVKMKELSDAQCITFGIEEHATVQAIDVSLRYKEGETFFDRINGLGFKVIYKGTATPILLSQSVGYHHVYTALAACAVGTLFDMNPLEIGERLGLLAPGPGRLRVLKGINHSVLLDDSYNSSPLALERALDTLCDLNDPQGNGHRRIAVLADMLDLGKASQEAHEVIGRKIAGLPIDQLVTIGHDSMFIAEAAKNDGMDAAKLIHFDDMKSAEAYLKENIQEEDILLVKGSRGIHLEALVEKIIDEPHRGRELLVSGH
ncbi:MAG: hypothetical protein A3H59_03200 [Candidatus Jacksonbacteria bacterium RIFCSPLOWO2_02_FULL_43_9]|nr:MAG: UDP-N-acetylmuramoyl-tripeptide-D-alanyl-D-alanine ligase MurF [Parcubacteria group bacterium GW2011_GWA2_43_13]OGY69542.1 MAG: hypothetical protein A3B94_03805 [Candidatus Jacksonbacteria bacterium RIFCSPHIGHO2_02_FULL_43_10]OGY70259.1 MAG: hypothetical protein A2986_04315 [Candidatus Jacksonbacteria bacterium RIFCSPLOWO2_01_FULL_44_13]OGY72912.1 MAG: hypothetical protein A3H59_03200 [Candidatus Jacksonbacteria bacterium RIFCSPLOWO2_02_FULL_43_9]HAZ16973.1 hypothetical protein [Candida